MARLYAAGGDAVSVVEDGSVETGLRERGARCLAVDPEDPDTLYVGTSDEGLFKSVDGGKSWDGLSGIEHPRITAVAVSPVDGAVYAGTEPSALFVSRDGGASWRELEEMRNLPSQPTWSFPPRPWTSHVRAIAPVLCGPRSDRCRYRAGRRAEEHRRRRDLAGPEARRPARLPLPVHPSRGSGIVLRGRRWRVRQEHGFRGQLGGRRRGNGPALCVGTGRGRGKSIARLRFGGPGPVPGAWQGRIRRGHLPQAGGASRGRRHWRIWTTFLTRSALTRRRRARCMPVSGTAPFCAVKMRGRAGRR